MKKPSPALIIACIALFVALGGTSYAALKLPKNSVGGAQIKKNAVTSAKVKNGSLTAADFKKSTLPAGPAGQPGTKGDRGPSASAAAELTRDPAFDLPGGNVETLMFSLTEYNDRSTGAITVSEPTRLIISSNTVLTSTADAAMFASCWVEHSSGGAWATVGDRTPFAIDRTIYQVSHQLVVNTFLDIGPGTHNLRQMCRTDYDDEIEFKQGSITAVATAR